LRATARRQHRQRGVHVGTARRGERDGLRVEQVRARRPNGRVADGAAAVWHSGDADQSQRGAHRVSLELGAARWRRESDQAARRGHRGRDREHVDAGPPRVGERRHRMGDEPEGLMSGRPADAPREARAGRGSSAGTDLTFALRQLRRHPAFAAVAVLTLALGIGVTTAMFSVVHRLLIDPIPYRNGDRIVRLYLGARGPMTGDGPEVLLTPSYRVVRAWRERSRTLEQLVSMQPQPDAAVGAG